MTRLAPKPWNDPWTRAAMRDPSGGYKAYCLGTTLATRMSWRRLNKLARKIDRTAPLGRLEQRIFNAAVFSGRCDS